MTTTRNADAIADAASTALVVRIHARYLSLSRALGIGEAVRSMDASYGALHAEFDADRGGDMQPARDQTGVYAQMLLDLFKHRWLTCPASSGPFACRQEQRPRQRIGG